MSKLHLNNRLYLKKPRAFDLFTVHYMHWSNRKSTQCGTRKQKMVWKYINHTAPKKLSNILKKIREYPWLWVVHGKYHKFLLTPQSTFCLFIYKIKQNSHSTRQSVSHYREAFFYRLVNWFPVYYYTLLVSQSWLSAQCSNRIKIKEN